jgi:hypothetical protein
MIFAPHCTSDMYVIRADDVPLALVVIYPVYVPEAT